MEIEDLTEQFNNLSIVIYKDIDASDYTDNLRYFYETLCSARTSKDYSKVQEYLINITMDELRALYKIYCARYIDITEDQFKSRLNMAENYYWDNRKQIYYYSVSLINMDSVAALIPEEIGLLTRLHHLTYSRNELVEVPNSVWTLSLLQHLDLSRNDLESVPDSIIGLKSLRTLLLNHNSIKTVSRNLYKLQKLQYVDLSYNPLKSMPSGIDRMQLLRTLRLHHTYMTQYPEGYKKCHLLTTTEPLCGKYTKNCMSWV